MDRTIARIVVVLGGIAVALAGVASAAGVFQRGDLATTEFVTVRGQIVQVVNEGIYRYNAEGIVAEGVGWDIVTLFVVVPVAFATLALLWRGSLRAGLVTAGLLTYFCYQSFEYAVFWAYGPLYPIYVATLALSVSALGLLVYGLDLDVLWERIGSSFPRRAIVGYSFAVVVILAGLWLPVLASTIGGEAGDELQGASTLVVPVFDLGLLVPLAVLTGFAAYQRLAKMGVHVTAGSDSPWIHYAPGLFVHEIELLAESGLSNAEAIVSATSGAAASVGMGERAGTLAVGRAADIVVDGDPLEDLGRLWQVRDVFKGGQRIGHGALQS